jgi:DNA-binding response OmpR family regulator
MLTTENTSSIVLLYVEDDPRLGRLTSTYLRHHGIEVSLITTGEQAIRDIDKIRPDVVLLDVMLPGMDGHQVCQRLRSRYDVPIIMISALDEEVDRVLGLEFGADDYITKPFSSRELLARVRAQARRARGSLVSAPAGRVEVGELVLDEASHTASLGGEPLQLTSHEFTLLHVLAQRAGRVLSREQLISLTRGSDDAVFDRAIDVQISRLRQKLGDNPRNPMWIKTIRGTGYLFATGEAR